MQRQPVAKQGWTASTGTHRSDSNTRVAELALRPPLGWEPSVCPHGAAATAAQGRNPPLRPRRKQISATGPAAGQDAGLMRALAGQARCATYRKNRSSAEAGERPGRDSASRRARGSSVDDRFGTATSAASNAAASEAHKSAITPSRRIPRSSRPPFCFFCGSGHTQFVHFKGYATARTGPSL